MSEELPLAVRLLLALAELQGAAIAPVSLPRLGKHLGQSASVLIRELSLLSDAEVGSQRGLGLVQIQMLDGHWRAALTEAGRREAAEIAALLGR